MAAEDSRRLTDRRSYTSNLDYCLSGLGLKGLTGVDDDEDLPGYNRFQIHLDIYNYGHSYLQYLDIYTTLSPECAKVPADHGAGVEDEGGGVEAQVEVGGDGHHQGALVAVHLLQDIAVSQVVHNSHQLQVNYHGRSMCQINHYGVDQKYYNAIDSNIRWQEVPSSLLLQVSDC